MRQVLLLATVLLLVPLAVVFAKSRYLTTFNNVYGTSNKTLDTCGTCHVNGYNLNSYGADFDTQNNQLGDETQAFKVIEPMDSDKDTYSNIDEINAGTFPGNNTSTLPTESSTWGKIKALYDN
ncbi:MAG: hypothetical protein JSW50_03870 [Candidatus Latescibacterota bacterium]|nr:MAG: hypothetical protein JSW50_03870 [Candidatus Latescibacterota bacterium]